MNKPENWSTAIGARWNQDSD